MSTLLEPTQLVTGMSHREMVDIMADAGIFCGPDKFARILQDAQRRALAHTALDRMAKDAEELGLYEEPKTYVCAPEGSGPCAKQTVTATVVAKNGNRYVGTNHCMNPQTICPRGGMATGQGYELCRSICKQENHAEVNAIELARKSNDAQGGTLYLDGHSYVCDPCKAHINFAGLKEYVIGSAPEAANETD